MVQISKEEIKPESKPTRKKGNEEKKKETERRLLDLNDSSWLFTV